MYHNLRKETWSFWSTSFNLERNRGIKGKLCLIAPNTETNGLVDVWGLLLSRAIPIIRDWVRSASLTDPNDFEIWIVGIWKFVEMQAAHKARYLNKICAQTASFWLLPWLWAVWRCPWWSSIVRARKNLRKKRWGFDEVTEMGSISGSLESLIFLFSLVKITSCNDVHNEVDTARKYKTLRFGRNASCYKQVYRHVQMLIIVLNLNFDWHHM